MVKKLVLAIISIILLISSVYAGNIIIKNGTIESTGLPNNYFLGQLGLGTNTPEIMLHLNKTDSATKGFTLENSEGYRFYLYSTPGLNFRMDTLRPSDGARLPIVLQPEGGNVGIGTMNPLNALHVISSQSGLVVQRFSDVAPNPAALTLYRIRGTESSPQILLDGDSIGQIRFNIFDGTDWYNSALILSMVDGTPGVGSTPGNIIFRTTPSGSTNPVERMVISSKGQVGINKTNPIEVLDVAGSIKASGTICDSVGCIGAGSSSWTQTAGNISRLTGLVGIGTNNPEIKFQIGNTDGADKGISLQSNQGDRFYIYSTADTNFRIDTYRPSDGRRLPIIFQPDGGRVGIGTLSPQAEFHVESSDGTSTLRLQELSGQDSIWELRAQNADNRLDIVGSPDGSVLSEYLTILSNSNIGIGTISPFTDLHISDTDATLRLEGSTGSGAIQFLRGDGLGWGMGISNTASKYFFINEDTYVAGIPSLQGTRLVMTQGGNVGIGTNPPTEKLDVAGNIKASGTICDSVGCIGGAAASLPTCAQDKILKVNSSGQWTCADDTGGNSSSFGEWITLSSDTVYQANSDGFVVYRYSGSASDGSLLQILSDGVNPPTQVRSYFKCDGNVHNLPDQSIIAPIRKGDYWEATGGNPAQTNLVYWIPASGGSGATSLPTCAQDKIIKVNSSGDWACADDTGGSGVSLGTWNATAIRYDNGATETIQDGTIYQADNDGFVLAINDGDSFAGDLEGYNGDCSGALTKRSIAGAGSFARGAAFSMPVRNGDCWRILNSDTQTYWIPLLGSGGSGSDLPTGAVIAFNLASCPSGWVLADGTGGTPDLRGTFIRGLDNGRGLDPTRVLGTYQDDELESHTHTWTDLVTSIDNGYRPWPANNDDVGSSSENTGATGGTETRPKNVALIYCIKS